MRTPHTSLYHFNIVQGVLTSGFVTKI